MPLCNELEDVNYYFNTKPEIITKKFKSVFSNIKTRNKYKIICHLLYDSSEVFFTIVKQTKPNSHRFVSSYTTFNSLKKRCIFDKYNIISIGFVNSYSIKTTEVCYYG